MRVVLETERLWLRLWEQADLDPYFRIHQDPKVTEYLGRSLTKEEAHDFMHAAHLHQEKYGYTFWAAEQKESGECMGFIGLQQVDFIADFTPAVEIGWRLGSQYWGQGYATEGARAALAYGFEQCALQEIVSFTSPANIRSRRVMEKIGFRQDEKGDFAHPKLHIDHPLSPHVLYRLERADAPWLGQ